MTTTTNRHFPSSGSIDLEWIETKSDEDPWLLISDDIDNPSYRDALVANGLIGLRVPPEGEGSQFTPRDSNAPGGCLMHGLWTDDRLMPMPQWHGLAYHDGQSSFARDKGEHRQYQQVLDMRTATLTTKSDWLCDGRRTAVETKLWLSLADTNLLVIETTITPDFDGEVTFTDQIMGVRGKGNWEILAPKFMPQADKDAAQLSVRMGERFRRIVARSETTTTVEAVTVAIATNCDHTKGNEYAERQLRFNVSRGQSYTVTKVAALVSDADSEQPEQMAQDLISRTMGDTAAARKAHEAAWAKRWQQRIEVGNVRLQRVLNASLYQCYSQLPTGRAHSVGPAALSGVAWHGRSFWDADLWTFPVVSLLQPDLGRCFTAYRTSTIEGARRNALSRGYRGACWAWESAETGDEKVPAVAVHHQRHINACVALGLWWDYCITGDEDFFRDEAGQAIIESAEYFASRVTWNSEQSRYELRHIKCPDENAGVRDNNATTNYSCVATLRLAQRACDILGQASDPQWQHIIDHMWVPMDEENRRVLEYEGFDEFKEYSRGLMNLKQADATLLVYPWEMPMDTDVKMNTLNYYRSLYDKNKIMMASAIDGIVDCELGDPDTAWNALGDLLHHFRGPFMLVSERPTNECLSFITGLGGLLQLVVMGFAGVRIHEEGIKLGGSLPSAVGGMRIYGLHFGGKSFDIVVDEDGARRVE